MKTTYQLAEIVADRVRARVGDDLIDLIADLTHDVLRDQGYDMVDADTMDTLMEVSGLVCIAAKDC